MVLASSAIHLLDERESPIAAGTVLALQPCMNITVYFTKSCVFVVVSVHWRCLCLREIVRWRT